MKICVALDSSVYFFRSCVQDVSYAGEHNIAQMCTALRSQRPAHSSQWERDQSCLHVQLTFQFSMVYGEPPTPTTVQPPMTAGLRISPGLRFDPSSIAISVGIPPASLMCMRLCSEPTTDRGSDSIASPSDPCGRSSLFRPPSGGSPRETRGTRVGQSSGSASG